MAPLRPVSGNPGGTSGKESAFQCKKCKRCGFDPWVQRTPGVGNDNPLQYSCLENSLGREAWWATVHGASKSQTWLSDWACRETREPTIGLPESGNQEAGQNRLSPALDPHRAHHPFSFGELLPPPPSWSSRRAVSSGSPGYILDKSRTGHSVMQLEPSSPAPPPASPAGCRLDESSLEEVSCLQVPPQPQTGSRRGKHQSMNFWFKKTTSAYCLGCSHRRWGEVNLVCVCMRVLRHMYVMCVYVSYWLGVGWLWISMYKHPVPTGACESRSMCTHTSVHVFMI